MAKRPRDPVQLAKQMVDNYMPKPGKRGPYKKK
jgi:hypothetical protein